MAKICYNNKYSDKLIEDTNKIYEPCYNKKLHKTETTEILNNLSGFFKVLLEMEEKYECKTKEK